MPMAASRQIVLEPALVAGSIGTEALEREQGSSSSATPLPLSGFIPEPPTPEELQFVQRIFFLSGKEVPRVVVFCGVQPGDGSEIVCARTAEVLSTLVNETVCIMDADFRSPSLHMRYDIDKAPVFQAQQPGEESEGAAFRMRAPSLWVLPAAPVADARPGLSPHGVHTCLSNLRQKFGFLLISAPALSTAAEGFLLGQVANGIVVTVLARSTQRAAAQKVRRNLEQCEVRLLGVAMHEQAKKFSWEQIRLMALRKLRLGGD
jgi:Mrp family chromosome partitioning ATPase